MRILVCVKQVPKPGTERQTTGSGYIDRTGDIVINPFDLYALEAAARLKDMDESVQITALSMGDESAQTVLHDSYAVGADQCLLISDPALAGADIRLTAVVLKHATKWLEKKNGVFDAIFCGAMSIDGCNAMLPSYLGELLGRAVLSYALSCEPAYGGLEGRGAYCGDKPVFDVLKENDLGNQVYTVSSPCVISFTKNSKETRYPIVERIIEASQMTVPTISISDIYGGKVSGEELPTPGMDIVSFEYRDLNKDSLIIQEKDQEEGARKLAKMLYDAHVI